MLRFFLSVIIIAVIITLAIIPLYKYLRRLGNIERNWLDQNLLKDEKGDLKKNDTNE